MSLGAQRRVFRAVVLVTLGLVAVFGLILAQPALVGGLAGDPTGGHIGQHFREPHHRIHDLAFGLLLGTSALGVLVQVRSPARNVAAQLMAAMPILALMLAAVATDRRVLSVPWVAIGAPTIVATLLHPDLFRSVRTPRPSPRMIVIAAIGALPLLSFSASNLVLQRTGLSDHAALGHYGYMAALYFSVIGVAAMSSLRLPGWRLSSVVAGSLAILLGVISLVWLDVEGSIGVFGALVAIAWGIGYCAVASQAATLAT